MQQSPYPGNAVLAPYDAQVRARASALRYRQDVWLRELLRDAGFVPDESETFMLR